MKQIVRETLEHGFWLKREVDVQRRERGVWLPTYRFFGHAALWEVQYDPSMRHVPQHPKLYETVHWIGGGREVMGVDRRVIKNGRESRLEVARNRKIAAPYDLIVIDGAQQKPVINPDDHQMVRTFLELLPENSYEQSDDVSGRRARELYDAAAQGLNYLCEHYRRTPFDGRAYVFNVANQYAVRISSHNKHTGGESRYSRFAASFTSALLEHQEIGMQIWRPAKANNDWAANVQFSAAGRENKMVMGRTYLTNPRPEQQQASTALNVDQISGLTQLLHGLCRLPEYAVSVGSQVENINAVSLSPAPVVFDPGELHLFSE